MWITKVLKIQLYCKNNFKIFHLTFRKNMKGINDIDEKICNKEYLMDLLSLLEGRQKTFYGFYLRFLRFYIDNLKLIFGDEKKYSIFKINLKKLLNILLRVKIILIFYKEKWIPEYYMKLVNAVDKMNEKNLENFLNHVSLYLKDFPSKDYEHSEEMIIVDGESGYNSSIKKEKEEDLYKKKKSYEILFKVILMENIQYIYN